MLVSKGPVLCTLWSLRKFTVAVTVNRLQLAFGLLAAASLLVSNNIRAAENEDWQKDWTIVTMARDGSWGTASHQLIARAIAAAIDNCKAMAAAKTDCGAEFRAVRSGWVLGLLCGDQKILASGNRREDAEADAGLRIDLKRAYIPGLPSCRTVLIVDSRGPITQISTPEPSLSEMVPE
jgi:hypothetical protein